MKFISLRFLTLAAVALLVSINAGATTIDFSMVLPPGDTGSPTYLHVPTGLIVSGLWLDDDEWEPANLYVRNQTNDHGFGICSPFDDPPCPGPSGGGDFNELDNAGAPEVIRLTRPAGYEWVSVQLSSLDSNSSTDPDDFERGQLWASAAPIPAFIGTSLLDFAGGGPVEPTFAVSDPTAPYLFFRPFDYRPTGTNDNNDFLVYAVTIERTRVPEPVTLGLLGIGFLALGVRRRRS